MLKVLQVKRLALQNAQGSRGEGGVPGRQLLRCEFIGRRNVWRSGGGLGGADLSAGITCGDLELIPGTRFIGRRSVWRS